MQLNALDQGHGPPLVILHGLFGNLDNFASLARSLSERWRVIRIDLPGHGGSDTLQAYDYPSMARSVQVTLTALNIGPCHLLGHSMGGKVAMNLAGLLDAPDLWSLVIVDIAPRRYLPHHTEILAALSNLDLSRLSSRSAADQALAADIPDAAVRAFLLKSLTRAGDSGWRWQFDLAGVTRDYDAIADAPRIARTIDCPTLFLKGAVSDYLTDGDEPVVARFFTQPSLRSIAGAGHWPHAEKPELFGRLVESFLTRHTPSAFRP